MILKLLAQKQNFLDLKYKKMAKKWQKRENVFTVFVIQSVVHLRFNWLAVRHNLFCRGK